MIEFVSINHRRLDLYAILYESWMKKYKTNGNEQVAMEIERVTKN